jgi:hypothetical protein
LYAIAPRTTRSAIAASGSAYSMASSVTATEKRAVRQSAAS